MGASDQRGQALAGDHLKTALSVPGLEHAIEGQWGRHAFQLWTSLVLTLKQALDQVIGSCADDDRIRCSLPLDARGNGGGLAQGELLLFAAPAQCANHDRAGVKADAHL